MQTGASDPPQTEKNGSFFRPMCINTPQNGHTTPFVPTSYRAITTSTRAVPASTRAEIFFAALPFCGF
nr:MAG TPA: hypothetical protein [Caudoviricetes sp.]